MCYFKVTEPESAFPVTLYFVCPVSALLQLSPGGKMENDLLFSVYYLLLLESIPPSTTGLKLLYPKLVQVFKALLLFHVGSLRSTPLPLSKCSMLYSKLNYFYRVSTEKIPFFPCFLYHTVM